MFSTSQIMRAAVRTHARNMLALARMCPLYRAQAAHWYAKRNEA